MDTVKTKTFYKVLTKNAAFNGTRNIATKKSAVFYHGVAIVDNKKDAELLKKQFGYEVKSFKQAIPDNE